MDFDSAVIVVSRYVGQARITDLRDFEARLREACDRSVEGELVGLLLLEVATIPSRPFSEEELDDLFYEFAHAARMVDLVAQVRDNLFVILEPELIAPAEARATGERVYHALARLPANYDLRLGLALSDEGALGARELYLRAESELEAARAEGSWSAREPVPSVRKAHA